MGWLFLLRQGEKTMKSHIRRTRTTRTEQLSGPPWRHPFHSPTHRFDLHHFFGRCIQGRLGPGADPTRVDHHHLALLGWKLGKNVRLEPPQHDCLLQQQLQLAQVGGARVVPAPRELRRKRGCLLASELQAALCFPIAPLCSDHFKRLHKTGWTPTETDEGRKDVGKARHEIN